MTQRCTNPECRRIRENLEEELRRLKSTSYDMMKQRGDWQCGGRTHDDHSTAFESVFLHEVEELSKHLQDTADLEESPARELLCHLFQSVYERCRWRILDRMRTTLSSVGSVSVIPGQSVSESEGIHDACRAYGLLLHSSQLRDIQEHSEVSAQVHDEMLRTQQKLKSAEVELEKFTKTVAQLSWDLLTTVPPLVCAWPSRYSSRKLTKENWNKSLPDFELVYFRPVLFSSYEGRVAKKGWVTNRASGRPTFNELEDEEKLTAGIPVLNPETGHGQNTDRPKEATARRHHRKHRKTGRSKNSASGPYDEFEVLTSPDSMHPGRPGQTSGVASALSDLLHGVGKEDEGEEELEASVKFESLSLLRLTNK